MKRLFLLGLILALTFNLAFADDAMQILEKDKAARDGGGSGEMLLGRGGPDAFGYLWVDSDEGDGPDFLWVDITGNGTEITNWNGTVDDGYVLDIPIGTTFSFYGIDYTTVTVSTNGWISFLPQTSNYLSNATIPTASSPNAIVAVEWDDLDGGTVGHCYYYYDSANNQFIVSWVGWPYYPDATTPPHDIQVILDADDMSITTQYANNAGAWQADITVGIENETGTDGLLVTYNVNYPRNDLACRFAVPSLAHDIGAGAFTGVPSSGQIGTPVTPQVTFRNWGTSAENNIPVRLIVNPGAYNNTSNIASLAPGATQTVTFPAFTPTAGGLYEFSGIAELAGDVNRFNDTSRTSMAVFSQLIDFEAGSGGLTGDGDWSWGAPSNPEAPVPNSGVNCWGTGMSGDYNNSTTSMLTFSGHVGANPAVSFAHWYDTEASYDGGNFAVSSDGGGTWIVISPLTGYSGVANNSNPLYPDSIFTGHNQQAWEVITFNLTSYANSDLTFRLAFGTDASVTYPGWFIDDMGLVDVAITTANISVVPGSISGRAPQEQTDRDTLTITNSGTAPLIVNITTQMNRVAVDSPSPIEPRPDMEISGDRSDIDNPNDPPVILDIVCPSGSLFGQDPTTPSDAWTFGTSDVEANYNRFESLTGTNAEITEIHFWGIDAVYSGGWSECDEDPADFQVIFYQDAGGQPGDPIATYNLTISGVPTGYSFNNFIQKEYIGALSPAVTIFGGWVSIQGTTTNGCWFLWQNSLTGDGMSYVYDGTSMAPDDIDLSVCIIGEVAVPWLSANPTSLTVPPSGVATVEVLMNATGQDVGILTGNVVVNSNDPDQGVITIPVTFQVDALEGVYDNASGLPKEFVLAQNYPNPFNPTTEIEFGLPVRSAVTLQVFNLLGQRVKTLVDAELEAGYRSVVWDGTSDTGAQLSSGTYFYILRIDGRAISKMMTMIK